MQTNRGTMAVQAGGRSADIEYLPFPERPPSRPASEDRSGPWNAILSFFGVRKAPPLPKRPPSVELQSGPSKPARQERNQAALVIAPSASDIKPVQPFPFLDLPFELLCEVIARVPPGQRHLFYDGSPLGTTCKAFYAAVSAVSAMPDYRDDDVIARRVVGMRRSTQVQPMLDAIVNAAPGIREWAAATVVLMTAGMPEIARRSQLTTALDRARNHSSLWEFELMRHLAWWIPDTDSELFSLLTIRALQFEPKSEDEYLAKARVLAQLAQRISPNDLAGTVRRWESIYQSVVARPRNEDVLTVTGLRTGFNHLSDIFQCKFSVDSEGMLLCKLIRLYRTVDSLQTKKFMAACNPEELHPRVPPTPLPGTVKPQDPMRALSSFTVRPIPTVHRLPSHIM
ncbi:hypothetical protein [Cupriavidus respiraculi]|uniref:hypothetical protein n=1 Tax=Cupriavidus respiraculi TaxID=195930 RepID=UPI001CC3693F|nr:hypothetical protein [Cupriavidus respiraculi]